MFGDERCNGSDVAKLRVANVGHTREDSTSIIGAYFIVDTTTSSVAGDRSEGEYLELYILVVDYFEDYLRITFGES